MRGTLLSRTPATRAPSPRPNFTTPPPPPIPTIRLTTATPCANTTIASSVQSPLSPPTTTSPRKRVVPKKSKLSLLTGTSRGAKDKDKSKDLSDVARRVGLSSREVASTGRSFDIYVDAADDPDIGEILIVKKKKSRAGLDGLWRGGALGDVTNALRPQEKEKQPATLKVKVEDKEKWWSIGRGRKESKKDGKEKALPKAPEPQPASETDSRQRAHSFDSGILLSNGPFIKEPEAEPTSRPPTLRSNSTPLGFGALAFSNTNASVPVPPGVPEHDADGPPAPPPKETQPQPTFLAVKDGSEKPTSGSMAIRAMRSVRSMAKLGGWATQLRAGTPSEELESPLDKDDKKKSKREKERVPRGSTSSFEAGALSPARPKGVASLMKLSTGPAPSAAPAGTTSRFGTFSSRSSASSSATNHNNANNRLSAGSSLNIDTTARRVSAGSYISVSGSSLEPASSASSIITRESIVGGRESKRSSASSVRWGDGVGVEAVRERRAKDGRERVGVLGGLLKSSKDKESAKDKENAKGRKEAEKKKNKEEKERVKKESRERERESRRSAEGRKRPALASLFPDTLGLGARAATASPLHQVSETGDARELPVVTIEAASPERVDETPMKKARPRPVSDQPLGRGRPKGIVVDGDGDGVMTILDAATADLASLINRLDLEATPDASPRSYHAGSVPRQSQRDEDDTQNTFPHRLDSPLKKIAKAKASVTSLSSLRPYAQSRNKKGSQPSSAQADTAMTLNSVFSAAVPPPIPVPVSVAPPAKPQNSAAGRLIGQQIAPWKVLNAPLMTVEEGNKSDVHKSDNVGTSQVKKKPPPPPPNTVRLTHKRTMSPPEPALEPMLVFQPLRPAKSRSPAAVVRSIPSPVPVTPEMSEFANQNVVSSSSMTFGSGSRRAGDEAGAVSPTPRVRKTRHKRASSSQASGLGMPIGAEGMRILGMTGTMGSAGTPHQCEVDPEDPDSDIPDELQVILQQGESASGAEDNDTMSYSATSSNPLPSSPPPSGPPNTPLPTPESALRPMASDTEGESDAPSAPVFRAHVIDDMGSEADIDEAGITSDEECTKKSFDFTGELQRLNESGASDRRSFVEQLENAFKTPAKIDLKCLGGRLGLGESFLMPLPALPTIQRPTAPAPPPTEAPPAKPNMTEDSAAFEVTGDMIMDINLQNSIQQIDLSEASKISDKLPAQPIVLKTHASQPHLRSVGSKASDGQLNRDFRFGGKPAQKAELKPVDEQPAKPLTLSDIIPPPSHPSRSPSLSFSMLEEDSSILKSIYAKAKALQAARPRVNSDSSSKRHARQVASHKRHSSELSFSGLSSFGEVRRGFEFGPDRPAFYPPSSQSQSYSFSRNHGRNESVFSIASVSSYGMVINSGSIDPFDYGLPPRPLSMDASVSFDDTFSFLNREPRRRRVDSDASSFYFNSHSQNSHMPRRRHRHNDSSASVMSAAPPISLYNRSFGAHRRNDSSTSASSLAHAYGTYGANGGRAAWARHQQDHSIDSVMSDFSAVRLGRPGLGDKMLESARDYAVPLTAISASPPGSDKSSREVGHQTSYDSIMDEDPRSSGDSIFDATGQRTSMSSDSVFGYDDHHPPSQGMGLFPPNQFRPLSVISIPTVRSPINEDDTMISMLAGGRVRRRSIGSLVEASPCVRAEKRMQDGNPMRVPLKGLRRVQDEDSVDTSPEKARLIEKISITSGSSHKFGGERMGLAQSGLLERQSLEQGCLSADGEELSASNLSQPVFRRPALANRSLPESRPESYVISSGAETPPLSVSDGSSQSSGSQSSIDLGRLNVLLTNATHPVSNAAMARSRARARGNGHRRRVSQAPASRTSVYETIEEEVPGLSHSHSPSPVKLSPTEKHNVHNSPADQAFFHEPQVEIVQWDDDDETVPTLRKYYALQSEATVTLAESKRQWEDTPFSIFAVQSFDPPADPPGMKALLEHSQKTYGPLPSDLRASRRRSRTLSRPSPYPRSMLSLKDDSRPIIDVSIPNITIGSIDATPLQEIHVNPNANLLALSPAPALNIKPVSPFVVDFKDRAHQKQVMKENADLGLPVPSARPRVPSNARRSALGWSKRSAGKTPSENKENKVVHTPLMSPNESLRIVRPRPRGRPTPARQQALRV